MDNTFTPKLVKVRGVEITVNSWEELDELMARYAVEPANPPPRLEPVQPAQRAVILNDSDRVLLEMFVKGAERGVPVNEIRTALGRGATGKVGSALKAWSAQIGLTPDSAASAFELRQRSTGRVHRLTNEALRAARVLLSQ